MIGPSVERVRREVPHARAYHSVAQAAADGAWTALALDSERYDNDLIHDTATNNSRMTCKTAGAYAIQGHLEFVTGAGSVRGGALRVNGSAFIALMYFPPVGGGFTTAVSIGSQYRLAVNDYVQLMVFQDTGGALNVPAGGNYSPELAMAFLGL